MSRVEIPLVVLNDQSPYNPVNGATCTITDRTTGKEVSVYSDSGGTNNKLTQPLTSDSAGRLTGWLERGAYECTVTIPGRTAYSEPFDAAPGKDGSVDTAWIASGAVTGEKVASAIKDGTAGTPSLRTLGTTSIQAAAGNDSRLSNERTPTDNSVTTTKLVAESVTSAKLGPEAVTLAKMAAAAKPLAWYTPKVIATEETITTTTYKKMSENGAGGTADEITGVVVPTNGLLVIGYHAMWKESVAGTARAAIFLGVNQLKRVTLGTAAPALQEADIAAAFVGENNKNKFFPLMAYPFGLEGSTRTAESITAYSGPVTTGQVLGAAPGSGSLDGRGGFCVVFAGAGTYSISVQFKASSGTVTAKERKLWVAALG